MSVTEVTEAMAELGELESLEAELRRCIARTRKPWVDLAQTWWENHGRFIRAFRGAGPECTRCRLSLPSSKVYQGEATNDEKCLAFQWECDDDGYKMMYVPVVELAWMHNRYERNAAGVYVRR